MNAFPRCDFLRVIVATALFGRLVDLENIDLILDEFSQVRVPKPPGADGSDIALSLLTCSIESV